MEGVLRPQRLETDPSSPDSADLWIHWKKTFSNFLNAVQTLNVDKLAMLTNFVAPSIYKHIAECSSYEDAMCILEGLFIQPKNIVFARHILSITKQEPGQSLDVFLQKLKYLAIDCDFQAVSAETHREEFIRDSFIRGLFSPHIRQRLLEEKDLDLKSAYDIARQLELAQKQSQTYCETFPTSCAISPQAVNQSDSSNLEKENTLAAASFNSSCYFCGMTRHPRSKCPARDAVCKSCGKKGHFQRVCRSKLTSSKSSTCHIVCDDASSLSSTLIASTHNSLSSALTHIIVNGVPMQALIDTGSSDSYISKHVVDKFQFHVLSSHKRVTMASTCFSSSTHGHIIASISIKDNSYNNIQLSVLSDLCTDVLLGHDFLKLHERVEIPFSGSRPSFSLCGLSVSRLEPQSLFDHLSPECTPISTKSRRYSSTDLSFIQSEIQALLQSGVIEPSKSPWRAQVLVISNPNHRRRMVVDYSQTINRFTYLDAYPFPRIDELVSTLSKYEIFTTLDLKSAYHQIPIKEKERKYTAFEACGKLYQFCRIPFGVTNGVACFQRTIDDIIRREKLSGTFAYVDNLTVCGNSIAEHDFNLTKFLEVANKYGLVFNESKSVFRVKKINLLGYEICKGTIKPDPERLKPLLELPAPATLKAQERVVGTFAYYSQWISHFSDKIRPLVQNRTFPLSADVRATFDQLKRDLTEAVVATIEPNVMFVVETDASDNAIAASLNQNGRPVAFFSRTLTPTECKHSAVEKEAYAIIESLKKWRHLLIGHHFRLVTDQRSVAFMFDNSNKGKIKNEKIQRWRIELSDFRYDIVYRPGKCNHVADTLSRSFCGAVSQISLKDLHDSLCHPGITRMMHFVRCRNLPFSLADVKQTISQCKTCSEIKVKFFSPPHCSLIKATQPFERISIDFKGPLPTNSRNRYLLTIIDEFSRFPFAYPCADMSTRTVIHCLSNLFSIFGMPAYVHSDRGSSFISDELQTFLHKKGIATSRTTAYNPQSNGQVERLNGSLWKAISLALKSRGLHIRYWETVLTDVLHSLRSLLCTATNETPHERLFRYNRKATNGTSLPSWLVNSDRVLLQRNNRTSKYEPLVEEVTLVDCNPSYARVRLQDGREDTVSLRQLAPAASSPQSENEIINDYSPNALGDATNERMLNNDTESTNNQTLDETSSLENLQRSQQRLRPYCLRNREA